MPVSKFREITCPRCQEKIKIHANPIPTVDIIIETEDGIVLIERKNPPFGWAIPGGFVDYGERAEDAAIREAKEETGLDVKLTGLLGVYSDPGRDPRMHTISTVFIAKADGRPTAGDDAKSVMIFGLDRLPDGLAFDHGKILKDYLNIKLPT
ncbi:MAG: NUDIX domain-containing protein [Dissulfurimicrobium sp.]|uniref:NUDIX domain-containing protein n=1 Tax=Dissulfurimicrobium sp. TaxID=2022436 RepID=UPI004049565E